MASTRYQERMASLLHDVGVNLRRTRLVQYHVSKDAMGWYKKHHVTVLQLPPASPQFNPIELAWG